MRVRTAVRGGGLPGEAVPEALLRIAEYQEQHMEEENRDNRSHSFGFGLPASAQIIQQRIESKGTDKEIEDPYGAHELAMASSHQTNLHL